MSRHCKAPGGGGLTRENCLAHCQSGPYFPRFPSSYVSMPCTSGSPRSDGSSENSRQLISFVEEMTVFRGKRAVYVHTGGFFLIYVCGFLISQARRETDYTIGKDGRPAAAQGCFDCITHHGLVHARGPCLFLRLACDKARFGALGGLGGPWGWVELFPVY